MCTVIASDVEQLLHFDMQLLHTCTYVHRTFGMEAMPQKISKYLAIQMNREKHRKKNKILTY